MSPILLVGSNSELDGFLFCLIFVAFAVAGWKLGVSVGYRRNFGNADDLVCAKCGTIGLVVGLLAGFFGPLALAAQFLLVGCLTPIWVFPFLTGSMLGCMFLGWRIGTRLAHRRHLSRPITPA